MRPGYGPLNTPAVRELYRAACHGAGAEVRTAARKQLEGCPEFKRLGLLAFFQAHNLDMAAYFASRPIS